jgi:hypothetical protein
MGQSPDYPIENLLTFILILLWQLASKTDGF